MTTVILSGGNGTRMWPVSRTLMPKQFVKLFGGDSLFQQTVKRNLDLSDNLMVISNDVQKFLVSDQLEELDVINGRFIWESIAKNSAAAIIFSALSSHKDEVLCVVPSDHLFEDEENYKSTILQAIELAKENNIVSIGIKPTYPATGYGYIKHKDGNINSFVEKPIKKVAEQFLESGEYLWNGGIYCFKVSHFLNECQIHIPELLNHIKQAYAKATLFNGEIFITKDCVQGVESISIDHSLMEKVTSNFKVVELSSVWNDMGSFDNFSDAYMNNYLVKPNIDNVISINSNNNCIVPSKRIIATVDVNDLIIVDTPDALLIVKKGSSQKVKDVVTELNRRDSDLSTTPSTVARPWGSYTVQEDSDSYKTKKIVVKPHKRLSLQSHFHRSEHWIVVSGTARVTVGEETKLLHANESTYIPAGYKHRLENPGIIDLVIIEAQVGEYLEEDDIVRYEDDFNRIA